MQCYIGAERAEAKQRYGSQGLLSVVQSLQSCCAAEPKPDI